MKAFSLFIIRTIICVFLFQVVANEQLNAQSDGFFTFQYNEQDRINDNITAPNLPFKHGLGDDYQLVETPLTGEHIVLLFLAIIYVCIIYFGRTKKLKSGKNFFVLPLLLCLGLNLTVDAQENYFGTVPPSSDGNTMVVVAEIHIDETLQTSADNLEIGAFCGDEFRGSGHIISDSGVSYLFLTIYGSNNTSDNVITLRIYDHNVGTELNLHYDYDITYSAEGIIVSEEPIDFYTIKYKFIGTDKNWNTISNWQLVRYGMEDVAATQLPSSNPNMADDIIVAADLDAAASYKVKDVVIETDKLLTITPQGALEIIGDIANTDVNALIINANNEGTGSLIHNDDNVNAKVKVNIDNSGVSKDWDADWHFISSPVAEQTIASFIPATENHDFYSWSENNSTWYNESADNHSNTNNFYTNNGENFVKGRAYLVAYENAAVKEFSGIINNGNVSCSLSYTESGEDLVEKYKGFNLVGNPYPSYIDWEAEGWTRDNLQVQTIWIYDDDVNNYVTYTVGGVSTNGGSQYIAPCQGFFVKASSAGNLVMTNEVRTNTKSSFRKDNKDNIIKIKVDGITGRDEIALVKNEGVDVFKMFSMDETAPSLYINKGDESYSVVYFDDEKTMPLSFEAGSFAKYTISLNEAGSDFEVIILEDRMTGEKINLLTESYTFVHSENNMKDRFVLTMAFGEDNGYGNDNGCFAYINNGELIVNGISGDAIINIYDVLGRNIIMEQSSSINGEAAAIAMNMLSKGVYIVQIIDDKGVKTQKIYFE